MTLAEAQDIMRELAKLYHAYFAGDSRAMIRGTVENGKVVWLAQMDAQTFTADTPEAAIEGLVKEVITLFEEAVIFRQKKAALLDACLAGLRTLLP